MSDELYIFQLRRDIEHYKNMIATGKQGLQSAENALHILNKSGGYEEIECTNKHWVGDRTCGEVSQVRDLTPVALQEYNHYNDETWTTKLFRCPKCRALNRLISDRKELIERIWKHSKQPIEYIEK